jgi:hypothetical protein
VPAHESVACTIRAPAGRSRAADDDVAVRGSSSVSTQTIGWSLFSAPLPASSAARHAVAATGQPVTVLPTTTRSPGTSASNATVHRGTAGAAVDGGVTSTTSTATVNTPRDLRTDSFLSS